MVRIFLRPHTAKTQADPDALCSSGVLRTHLWGVTAGQYIKKTKAVPTGNLRSVTEILKFEQIMYSLGILFQPLLDAFFSAERLPEDIARLRSACVERAKHLQPRVAAIDSANN